MFFKINFAQQSSNPLLETGGEACMRATAETVVRIVALELFVPWVCWVRGLWGSAAAPAGVCIYGPARKF